MTTSTRRATLALATALLVAGAGCSKQEVAPQEVRTEAKPFAVQTAPIEKRQVPRVLPLTGTLTAELRTELAANATGRVVKTYAERGQKVEKGAVLAQLDIRSAVANAAEARASVASAKTQLDAARAECERYDVLVARGAITQQEHDRQTASCKQQLAAVAVTEARASSVALVVGDGTIRAPFAGVITERLVSAGDYVQASSKVVTIVVSNPLRLQLTVPERRIGEVREGELVTFAPSALPGRTFSGEIKYVSGEVRSTTRDLVIEAVVPNADGALLPGMFVEASLHTGQHEMPVVPKSAVFTTGVEKSVYVVVDKHLELRIVKLGVEAGDGYAIEEGAEAGEHVVLKPTPSMSDGAQVE